jgi:hypothetical protein
VLFNAQNRSLVYRRSWLLTLCRSTLDYRFYGEAVRRHGIPRGRASALIVRFLRKFVHDTFDHKPEAKAEFWPHLEDVFTCVDLSANTGHHLGSGYSPSDLRAVRRALIVRIIRMLRHAYTNAKDRNDEKWRTLEEFFGRVRARDCAFLCMNWDTVIDEGMYARRVKNIDYGCNAKLIRFDDDDEIEFAEPNSGVPIQILKVHGSANWLYCDACRDVFWIEPGSTLRVADQLFRPRARAEEFTTKPAFRDAWPRCQ